MCNVYVRLTEADLSKIQQTLSHCKDLDSANLVAKIDLLIAEMQPGTTVTLEAVQRQKKDTQKAG